MQACLLLNKELTFLNTIFRFTRRSLHYQIKHKHFSHKQLVLVNEPCFYKAHFFSASSTWSAFFFKFSFHMLYRWQILLKVLMIIKAAFGKANTPDNLAWMADKSEPQQ
jgi:hypothetical protein